MWNNIAWMLAGVGLTLVVEGTIVWMLCNEPPGDYK